MKISALAPLMGARKQESGQLGREYAADKRLAFRGPRHLRFAAQGAVLALFIAGRDEEAADYPRQSLELIAMQDLSPEGLKLVDDLARRHGVSAEAVAILLRALARGDGVQAQFNHPDLGGMGQWSQGGMIMIGDMFNQGLKARVDQLCRELADLLRGEPLFRAPAASQSQVQGGVSLFIPGASSGAWWPPELGAPAATGAQNDLRYAFFPAARRLAIRLGGGQGFDGQVNIYDTGDHAIAGFSQQQSGDQSVTFTSQHGRVRVADLPLIGSRGFVGEAGGGPRGEGDAPQANANIQNEPSPPPSARRDEPRPQRASSDEIFAMLERLADLRQKNILTEQEFAAKKTELLSRL